MSGHNRRGTFGKQIRLFFQDEAKFGQKGRPCHRWWLRGCRPGGPRRSAPCIRLPFAAVEPATGRDFCLVLPVVSTAAMSGFLRRFLRPWPPMSMPSWCWTELDAHQS